MNSVIKILAVLTALCLAGGCGKPEPSAAAGPGAPVAVKTAMQAPLLDRVSFSEHVRPIISDRCFACHGPDADNQESPFRLDSQEASRMNLAGEGEPPRYGIVPGQPDESLMLARIQHEDPNQQMPPPEAKKKKITPEEVALLRQWILDGALYEKHWAFVPPSKPALPPVRQTAWVRNPIDRFVLAKLESRQIKPSPEADRETLIRRVYLDLTGLPPRPEEIDTFIADPSANAYEKMVDRVLQSPHYGERMAIDWLDTARYADTNAIHVDMMRTSWPWRDWVINAFNRNMPYHRFIIEQLAGDLLPNPTLEQQIATSFNRNHGITNEGGAISEEFLVEYAVDRVSTMGSAFMGLTVGCARCHDHKFDPITQDDFFSFVSFFNNIEERGLEAQNERRAHAYPPFVYVYSEEEKAMRAFADKTLGELDALKQLQGADAIKVPGDEKAIAWKPMDLVRAHSTKKKIPAVSVVKDLKKVNQNGISQIQGSRQVHFNFDLGVDADLELAFKPPPQAFNVIRVEAEVKKGKHDLQDEALHQAISEIEVALHQGSRTQRVAVVRGYSSLDPQGERFARALDNKYDSSWDLGVAAVDHHFFLFLQEPVSTTNGTVMVRFHYKGPQPKEKFVNHLTFYTAHNPHDQVEPLQLIPAKKRLAWHNEALFLSRARQQGKTELTVNDLHLARAHHAYLENNAVRCMVMEERDEVRPTYVLNRGLYDQPLKDRPRERVTPPVFPPMPEGAPKNRLGLAQWLVADTHPLTARVAVNRFWQQLFQNGIVKTSDDFGLQSDLPSHSRLLDYLAVDFLESGWDVKRLMKLMVMSATYRQASTFRVDLKDTDPENRLLARAPRYRLPAEVIRDNALSASGLLNDTLGGPSVKPYQPPGLWREKTMRPKMNTGTFTRDTGDKLYRRGMYTFWKQASPPPQMELFDAPSREACVVKRRITNTPLQALVLMNDETYLEFSRELATRLFKEMEGAWEEQLPDRLARGLRLATGREPTDSELQNWMAFTRDNLARFAAKPEDAAAFLSYGEKPIDPALPEIELAALTFSMSAVLNLDETITRD